MILYVFYSNVMWCDTCMRLFTEKAKKGKKYKKEQNVWKFGQKCKKFENVLKKSSWLHAIIAHNKLLEKALFIITWKMQFLSIQNGWNFKNVPKVQSSNFYSGDLKCPHQTPKLYGTLPLAVRK